MQSIIRISLTVLVLLSSLELQAQCHRYLHSNAAEDGWLSCQPKAHPIDGEAAGHWVQYDLGYAYTLGKVWIWNYNDPENKNFGFRQTAVHYSKDGQNWDYLGAFELPKANGSNFYGGALGPDFAGVEARYVVFTAVSTWGAGDCAGLAEVQFNILGSPTSTEAVPAYEGPELALYPNPASTEVLVKLRRATMSRIEILSLAGQLLQEHWVATDATYLDLTSLATGFYLVRVHFEEGTRTKKLVVVE